MQEILQEVLVVLEKILIVYVSKIAKMLSLFLLIWQKVLKELLKLYCV